MTRWKERGEDLENQLNKGALWAITYGDLMSFLMVFFLILFSFSLSKKVPQKKIDTTLVSIERVFGGKVSPELEQKVDLKEKEETAVSQIKEKLAKIDPRIQVLETEQKVRLILQEPVLFDLGRSELKIDALHILEQIMEPLKAIPNQIVVEGHTDNIAFLGRVGKYSSNWELSMGRAFSVIQFLEKKGISPERLSGLGYGEYQPVASNQTAEGRQKNRRIEINLIKKG